MNTEEKQKIYIEYSKNNMQKLKWIAKPKFLKFGGISQKDHDDFYSKANEELWKAAENYEETLGIPFEEYLKSNLERKFISELNKRNAKKRIPVQMLLSIDTPLDEEDDITLADVIADDFDIEKEIFEKEERCTPKMQKYLNRLSKRQREIVQLQAFSYSAGEIQQMLHLTKHEYADALLGIHSYQNIRLLL